MLRYLPVRRIHARQILDSRGVPTVEVEATVGEGIIGIEGYTARAIVPSGASTGRFEAIELRDGEKGCYLGLGVQKAVENVNTRLAEVIVGENALDQVRIDELLIRADGTENKVSTGANAVLGVSMAIARAAAMALRIPLYQYLGGCHTKKLPVPMMNIMNGGKHADNTIDIQEFMIVPSGAETYKEGLRMCAEVYQMLKKILKEEGLSTAVGDEGGFAPDLPDAGTVLEWMEKAVRRAGYEPGQHITFALDVAASELYDSTFQKYVFEGEGKMQGKPCVRSSEELIDYYEELLERFPIVSLEDPLDEEDWDGWELITTRLGLHTQLVGDDLFVTNTKRLKKGIRKKVANAILIKVNQIGTLTEAFDAIELAKRAGYQTIISHRSGETADTMIADIAVAFQAGQIKTGAPCRMERVEKYNQLLRIEERLGEIAQYPTKTRN